MDICHFLKRKAENTALSGCIKIEVNGGLPCQGKPAFIFQKEQHEVGIKCGAYASLMFDLESAQFCPKCGATQYMDVIK